MTVQLVEEGLVFTFCESVTPCRPGGCVYYREHFQKAFQEAKETDFVAYDTATRTLWLLEVKDYRHYPRTKPMPVWEEVALKVRSTLALLLAASTNDPSGAGSDTVGLGPFWSSVRKLLVIRVALHLELPSSPSKLHPGVKDAANVQAKLRRAVRPVDPHATVMRVGKTGTAPWSVQ